MSRLARAEIVDPHEVSLFHVMARTVRRCFLLGDDSVTLRNFDHRKAWIEDRFKSLAANMGIDLIAFALMSNHIHLVLRSRPDVVASWNDTEVAGRWLALCPPRKILCKTSGDGRATPVPFSESDLDTIRNNPKKLAEIRTRLSNISWWMRLLCQHIAQRANREEGEGLGKFWQSRFKAVRILDEETLLACAVYVDLNPIRAAIARTIEDHEFTSANRRMQSLHLVSNVSLMTQTACGSDGTIPKGEPLPDSFLSPVANDELNAPVGPQVSESNMRCSDKGFVRMSAIDYVELLDWTARQFVPGKRGATPASAPQILERLGINRRLWTVEVEHFGKIFGAVAGRPTSILEARTLKTHRRFHLKPQARSLLHTG